MWYKKELQTGKGMKSTTKKKKKGDREAYKSKERIQRKAIILQERFQTTKINSGNIYTTE
jgi:hypothetical protein